MPRHWDLDEHGQKKPNKWKAWSSFEERGFINDLSIRGFRRMAIDSGFVVDRMDLRSFGGPPLRNFVGTALKILPFIGSYFVSSVMVELRRPE